MNQIVASEMLAKHGYACDIVDNGRKAVAAVSAGGYDLVLMDCSMPEMDGFEATRQIRRRRRPIRQNRHGTHRSSPSPPMPSMETASDASKPEWTTM